MPRPYRSEYYVLSSLLSSLSERISIRFCFNFLTEKVLFRGRMSMFRVFARRGCFQCFISRDNQLDLAVSAL